MGIAPIFDHPLGRLDWSSLPFWEMLQHPTKSNIINGCIGTGAASMVVIGAIVLIVVLTKYRLWRPLWTSPDHKKIGIMYVVIALVMLARALIEAVLMRAQQAYGLGGGFLSPDHFAQLFSTHGTIMIFFMAMPFLTGIINYIMPMQIGARDVSFPVLNSISLGLTAAGAALVMVLDLGAESGLARFDADRYQLCRDDIQGACAGHDPDAHATVHVDRAVHGDHHDLRHAAAHCGHGAAGAGSLSRLPLFHQRVWRQHDELCQSVLAVWSS